jgi:hypothetical protein
MAPCFALEAETEAVGVAVADTKAVDGVVTRVDDPSFLQGSKLQRDRRSPFAPEAGEHPRNDVESARATVNTHELGTLLQSQRGKESGNAEHMVEMTVCQQEPIQPSKTDSAPEQLPLSPLSAIYQDPVAACLNEEPRMVAIGRWNARGSPEKSQTEHLVYASACVSQVKELAMICCVVQGIVPKSTQARDVGHI